MAERPVIKGNEQNIDLIARSFRKRMLSHAYIISGEEGTGAEDFADYIAAAIQCNEQRPGEDGKTGGIFAPCGHCPSCVKAFSRNHPDIIHVEHAKSSVLSIDEIRTQVVEDISIKPYYGPYKIYIVNDAQLMNESGQNALLKTIEEPEAYGIILLLTDNADGFLQTIRSRCITLYMDPLTKEAAAGALLDEDGTGFVQVLKDLKSMNSSDIFRHAKECEDSDRVQLIRILRLWFRDVLVIKSTGMTDDLFFADYRDSLELMAGETSFEGLNRIILAVDEAEARLKASVKAEAVYESLFLTVRRELGRKQL
ncbi:MAG: hypothetical protein HUJ76_07110 [Parasporobacterium sp.]|nr:hypothetical protein [Parasporobacterium sp.]